MRIAVFGTMWNEEVMNFYYQGFNKWASQNRSIVDMFVCYGRMDISNPFNYGEYAIFDYPTLEEYDGAIMIASTINEDSVRERLAERIRQAGIPAVVMDGKIDGFSTIYIDQEEYIRELVCHLHDVHQITKIAYIGGPASNVESKYRYQGFLRGMKESGLSVDEELVFTKSFCFNDGCDVAEALLSDGKELPEGIVCANDDMAVGVCETLLEAGISIGKDCLVTGFDQYFIGENYAPTLTTIRRPRASIAYHACQMLSESWGSAEYQEHANIIYGQTCGCAKGKCQNDVAFRRTVFHTYNDRNVISDMLTHMEEGMIVGDSLEVMLESIKKVLQHLGKGRCCIVLQPEVETNPHLSYHSYRSCSKEYLMWDAVDGEVMSREGHAYVYAPIHFMDHLYGYCVFRDISQFINNRELYNFTKSLGFSLENMVQKKRYTIINDKLQGLYETDYLTGVFNRHGFAKYAEEMLEESRKNRRFLQVIFADIDGLKKINDQYGHEAGDVAIRIVGHSATMAADENTKVFRYGGDEFLILRNGDEDFEPYQERVKEQIRERQETMLLSYKVSASIGCVKVSYDEKDSLETYIKQADDQMYILKQKRHQTEKD